MTNRIIHVVDLFDSGNEHDQIRKEKAKSSWKVLCESGVFWIHPPASVTSGRRNSMWHGTIGDDRKLGFFKDFIKWGLELANNPNDIVFWTNDDTILHPNFREAVMMHCAIHEVATGQRREMDSWPSQQLTPEQIVGISAPSMGRDVIAATRTWWERNWSDIPDFLLAASDFDLWFAAFVRRQKAFRTTHANLFERFPPCELAHGLIGHENHPSKWRQLGSKNPANAYNQKLFKEWADKHAPEIPVPI